jgi:hypothetical protein
LGIVWEYRIVLTTASAVLTAASAVSTAAAAVSATTAAALSCPAHVQALRADESSEHLHLLHAAPQETDSAEAREPEFSVHTREGSGPCQSE